jgi:hypothetical protein
LRARARPRLDERTTSQRGLCIAKRTPGLRRALPQERESERKRAIAMTRQAAEDPRLLFASIGEQRTFARLANAAEAPTAAKLPATHSGVYGDPVSVERGLARLLIGQQGTFAGSKV